MIGFIHVISHQAFSSYTAGLLGSFGQAFFSQVVDCLVHIPVGSSQGLFAVHHAGTCTFTQFFYHASSNCHQYSSCTFME